MQPRTVVTISGTSRPDNYTSHALAVVEDELTRREVTWRRFDARQLTLAFPGHPETDDARALMEAVKGASAVVLATPEYHGTFCAMTKLILENLGFPSVLRDKPVALLGVAAGRIGAVKSLEQLRGVCAHMGAHVLPLAISIAGVRAVFDAEGTCIDAGSEKALRGLGESLLGYLDAYVCPRLALEEMVREGKAVPWSASV